MKRCRWVPLDMFLLLAMLALASCQLAVTDSPGSNQPLLTAAEIKADYGGHIDQAVKVRGYGVAMMMVPLCPGYMGMDKRTVFVDEANDNITAVVMVPDGAERSSDLHEFKGYVRLFSGEIGCPGSLQTETFPYFEIVAIK